MELVCSAIFSFTPLHNISYHKFVTYYIALAYAVGGEVFVHTEWASLKYTIDEKPKTIILLDENHNALGFGKDAKHTLSPPISVEETDIDL